MNININLNRTQADKLLMIHRMVKVNDPDITIEDYAASLFADLISRIWDDIRNEILN